VLGLVGTVHADQTNNDALLQKIERLEAQVTELQGQKDGTWLNERRQEEVKALIRDVLDDADTRASLAGEGMTAGHDGKNFFLSSEDGGFSMSISGGIQIRYVYNNRDDEVVDPTDPDGTEDFTSIDENEAGFEVRRTKLRFSGHIASPKLGYVVQLAVDRSTNNVAADEIYITYKVADGITLWTGERKAPFLREELIAPWHQLAVDRSLVNELFTAGYVQGIGAEFELSDMFRASVAITDGVRSAEAGSTFAGHFGFATDEDGEVIVDDDGNPVTFERSIGKGFADDQTDFAITARLDVKVAGGSWDQWGMMSSQGADTTVFVGGAIHWELGETGDSNPNTNFFAWTIDASITTGPLTAFAAVVGLHTDNDISGVDEFDLYGIVLQAGFKVTEQIEPFVRYEYIDLDDLQEDDINLITFGANYYLNGDNAKITLDLVWALDPLSSTVAGAADLGSLGLLPDDGSDADDQFALRIQLQLLF
jgi:hypothetical protein